MRHHGGKGFARNEGMGEFSANEGNKTDHQTDQKFNHKVPSGYTKIGPHTGSDVVQVTEDYHPPDPDYWEEIMPQFDLDDAAVKADLIVEEVSCNMIELESENDESQCDDEFCVEDSLGQLCTSTPFNTPLHTVQLKPDEISSKAEDLTGSDTLSTSMITHAFSKAVDSHDPDNTFSFNDDMADDDEPLQMLTSEETQLVGKGTVNSVCTRESSPTGKILRLPELFGC